MAVLLYSWDFRNLESNEVFDEVNEKIAVVVDGSGNNSYELTSEGVQLNNTDLDSSGTYIDLSGLNDVPLTGPLTFELVLKDLSGNNTENIQKPKHVYYFQTRTQTQSGLNVEFFTIRERKESDDVLFIVNPSGDVPIKKFEFNVSGIQFQHYVASLSNEEIKGYINYTNQSGRSVSGELQAVREINYLGACKGLTEGTFLNGVIKYFKIYEGAMTDTEVNNLWDGGNVLLDTSDICFPKDTPVETDQGIILIQNITKKNTIHGLPVKKLLKTTNTDGTLILIKQGAFGHNIPNRDTYISRNHGIYVKANEFIRARNLVNNKNIFEVKTEDKFIYNILLSEYSSMYINDICCETLNPKYKP